MWSDHYSRCTEKAKICHLSIVNAVHTALLTTSVVAENPHRDMGHRSSSEEHTTLNPAEVTRLKSSKQDILHEAQERFGSAQPKTRELECLPSWLCKKPLKTKSKIGMLILSDLIADPLLRMPMSYHPTISVTSKLQVTDLL